MGTAGRTSTPELPSGVSLSRSALGGFAVYVQGDFAGWIHGDGERWRAYRRAVPPRSGELLGSFRQEDAVRKIAEAARAAEKDETPGASSR